MHRYTSILGDPLGFLNCGMCGILKVNVCIGISSRNTIQNTTRLLYHMFNLIQTQPALNTGI